MKEKLIILSLALLMILSIVGPVNAYQPQDVPTNHWALEYISPLLDKGIMYIYEDGNFSPNQAITRGEFAYSLAKALKLQPSIVTEMTDITNHPAKGYISALVKEGIITGYPDNTFRPYNKITRAEIITMLSRSLQLDDEKKKINLDRNYYYDVSNEHWANNLISLATELSIIDGYPDGSFKPNNYVTKAESAKLLVKLSQLTGVEGQVIETYPISKKVKLKVGNQIEDFNLAYKTLIGRNTRLVGLEKLLVSDNAYLILNKEKEVIYLKAYGLISEEDVAEKVSDMTNDFLSAEELIAISNRDWDSVTPRLKQELTFTLLEEGLTINEVQSLLNQDWDELKTSGKDRLIEAISINTNIPKEVIEAAAAKDWDSAKELAKTSLIKTAIEEIMSNSSLLS